MQPFVIAITIISEVFLALVFVRRFGEFSTVAGLLNNAAAISLLSFPLTSRAGISHPLADKNPDGTGKYFFYVDINKRGFAIEPNK